MSAHGQIGACEVCIRTGDPAHPADGVGNIASFVASTPGRDGPQMHVRDGMSSMVLTVGPGHTLRHVAKLMSDRRVGAAVVLDPDGSGPAIITERDVLEAVGTGQDPDV